MNKLIIKNISQIATPVGKRALHGKEMGKIRIIQNAAIFIEDGIIREVGSQEDVLKKAYAETSKDEITEIDAEHNCVIPGFVDSHTHFIFGGYRPKEFILRLQGASYMDIMKAGGGIENTVMATRKASYEELYELGQTRISNMLRQGITTVEGKSGYGLDLDTELLMIDVMERLNKESLIDIAITFLGAHAVSREYKDKPDEYIDFLINDVLPKVRESTSARFCDVFCEEGVFDIAQSRRLLEAAKKMGFGLKMHADEIVSIRGAQLSAELDCVSADHLLAASDEGIRALAKSNTIATLLPGTAFCLGKPYADARKMIDEGCAVALASDLNPGSCFSQSIPLLASLGAIQMKMTPEEVLCALTLNGAAALSMADSIGTIEAGKKADINILGYDDYRFLIYNTGANIVKTVIKNGELV